MLAALCAVENLPLCVKLTGPDSPLHWTLYNYLYPRKASTKVGLKTALNQNGRALYPLWAGVDDGAECWAVENQSLSMLEVSTLQVFVAYRDCKP